MLNKLISCICINQCDYELNKVLRQRYFQVTAPHRHYLKIIAFIDHVISCNSK